MSPNRYDMPVSTIFGTAAPDGEIGLEIEVEGTQLPGIFRDAETGDTKVPVREFWRVVDDGSLRRINTRTDLAVEYVLSRPVDRDTLKTALKYFEERWTEAEATSYNSYRTSVHVHLNVADWPMRRVYSFLATYFVFENILTEFADGGTGFRLGNRFCLRASDAGGIIEELQRLAKGNFRSGIDHNTFKYGAVNIAAMARYGSLEFRALRGTVDVNLIELWVNLLLKIKDYSEKIDYPTKVVEEFSQLGAEEFTRTVFGDLAQYVQGGERGMYESMRLAQDVAYSEQWQEPVVYKAPTSKKKPATSFTWVEAPEGRFTLGDFVANTAATPAPPPVPVAPVIQRATNLNYGRPL